MSNTGLTAAQSNNFLSLEPQLVAAVKAAVAGLSPAVHVLTAADLSGVKESAQRTPAVHIIYGGYTVAEDLLTAWRLSHTWYAVVVVRNVADQRSGAAARASAGPLLALVVGALAGASLPGLARALVLGNPPRPEWINGVQYLPTSFTAETIFRKP